MIISGNRITLKRVTEADLDFVCRVESDKELWRYNSSVETDHEQLRKTFEDRMRGDFAYDFVMRLGDPAGVAIGLVYIWNYIKERSSWELGYCVLPEYQQQGFCTEALKLLLHFGFTDLKAHKIVAMCNEHNAPSYQVMEKVGMVREGVFREEYLCSGQWVNQLFYCMLESEYGK